MAKYVIYHCDVCNRQKEIKLNAKSFDPIRCNITLKCTGKFIRVGERGFKKFLTPPIVAELQDYVPRGTVVNTTQNQKPFSNVSLYSSSGTGVIAITGFKRREAFSSGTLVTQFYLNDISNQELIAEQIVGNKVLPSNSSINLILYELNSKLLAYKKYTFFTNQTQLLRGSDNSSEAKNLRFNQFNRIKIVVNGVELLHSEYDSSIDNQITFTPLITSLNNVIDIFVYNDVRELLDDTDLIKLSFKSLDPNIALNSSIRNLNCWGDFYNTILENQETVTLFCTDFSALNSNKVYGVLKAEAVTQIGIKEVSAVGLNVLLGKSPFAFQDKELLNYAPIKTLIDLDKFLYFDSSKDGNLQLLISEEEVEQTASLIIGSRKVSFNSLQDSSQSSTNVNILNNRYILGPS